MNPDFLDIIRVLLDADVRFTLAGVSSADFASPEVTFQIGISPRRIDILTQISGVTFDEAWADHCEFSFGPFTVPFLSKAAVIKNKRAAGRPKDIADLDALEKP